MKKTAFFFGMMMIPCALMAQGKADPVALLRRAELKRMPWKQMSITAQLTDNVSGNPGNAYRVLLSDAGALVISTNPETSKGNLLLLQKNDVWIYFRGTKQASKIASLQRLSGAVSYVDLARLNWSEDYFIGSTEIEKQNETKSENEIIVLHLNALSKENSYQKIDLWINEQNERPVRTDIYLVSGRLFKTIQFTKFEKIEGKDVNSQVVITDHLAGNKQSVINFSNVRKEIKFPAYYFIKDSLPLVSREVMR